MFDSTQSMLHSLLLLHMQEVESDAEVLAQSAAHMVAREAMALKLAVLGRQMEAKQKRLAALQGAADIEGAKTKYMLELQKERDRQAKEKTELMKVNNPASSNILHVVCKGLAILGLLPCGKARNATLQAGAQK